MRKPNKKLGLDAARRRATELQRLLQWKSALELWQKISEAEPLNPVNKVRAGECLRKLGRDDEAVESWIEASKEWIEGRHWNLALAALNMARLTKPGEPVVSQLVASVVRLRCAETDRVRMAFDVTLREHRPLTEAHLFDGLGEPPEFQLDEEAASVTPPDTAASESRPTGIVPIYPLRPPSSFDRGTPGELGSQPVERASRTEATSPPPRLTSARLALASTTPPPPAPSTAKSFDESAPANQTGRIGTSEQPRRKTTLMGDLFARAARRNAVPPSTGRRWRVVREPDDTAARIEEVVDPKWGKSSSGSRG